MNFKDFVVGVIVGLISAAVYISNTRETTPSKIRFEARANGVSLEQCSKVKE